jgi:N-acetylmuramoyl-L-alanine amidase
LHLLFQFIISVFLLSPTALATGDHSGSSVAEFWLSPPAKDARKKAAKPPKTKAKKRPASVQRRTKRRVTTLTTRRLAPSGSLKRVTTRTVRKGKVIKTTKTTVLYENLAIMGSSYARIPILDSKLQGTVYYLASGHGGPDPGAIGVYGKQRLPEDEYAYDVTLRLARVLIQHGATVYMIVQDRNDGIRDAAVLPIDNDEVAYPNLTIPLNQTNRLHQTTTAVNGQFARHKERYQRFVTIHVDSRSKGETTDVFFYHHPQSRTGLRLAKHIHKTFKAMYRRHRPARPYMGRVSSRGSLYVVKNSHPPTVFIELGNIQNSLDQRRFLQAQNRQALANWMCQGMITDYKSR